MERKSRLGAGALLLRHWQAAFAALYALCGLLPFVWLYTGTAAPGQYNAFSLPTAMTLQVLVYPVFLLLLYGLAQVNAGLRSVSGPMSAVISVINLGFLVALMFTIQNTAGDTWPGQSGTVLEMSMRAGYYVLFALTLLALTGLVTGWRLAKEKTAGRRQKAQAEPQE